MNSAQRQLFDWFTPACNQGSPYITWEGGQILGDGPPPWSDDSAPLPSLSEIVHRGGFCAAVGNILRRRAGLDVPDDPDYPGPDWDGGVRAWYRHYYSKSMWVEDRLASGGLQDGDVLLSEYQSPAAQGHWAVYYQGYLIEWILYGGLVWQYTYEASNDWGHYTIVLPVDLWLPIGESGGFKPPAGRENALTPELLVRAMSGPWAGPDLTLEDAKRFLPAITKYCQKYEINTRARFSAWCGEMGTESGSFQWWEEFGQPARFGGYHGRGPGQMTWEDTYREFQASTGWPAHDNPSIVSDPDNPDCGFEACCWLWDQKDLNYFADLATWDSYSEITYRWLGAYEHPSVPEREARYGKSWEVLPADLVLGSPPIAPDEEDELDLAKYNIVADMGDTVSRDIANAAYVALESLGVDCLAINGTENVKRVVEAAARTGDLELMNCLVVGPGAHVLAGGQAGWAMDNPVWDLSGPAASTTLHKVIGSGWALDWIANTEGLNKQHLKDLFRRIFLQIAEGEYGDLLRESEGPDQPDPPPPPAMTLEQRVERLERKVGIEHGT